MPEKESSSYARRICFSKICEILRSDGFVISREAISFFHKRYVARGNLFELKRSGRKKASVSRAVDTFIDTAMEENNELTARKLSSKIKEKFALNVPERTVRRLRANLGWRYANTKYAQMVRYVNRKPRVNFCHYLQQNGINFRNPYWIFSDECTVQLERHAQKCFMKNNQRIMLVKSKANTSGESPHLGGNFVERSNECCHFSRSDPYGQPVVLPNYQRIFGPVYCLQVP